MSEPTTLAEALAAFQADLPTLGKDNTANVRSDKGNYSYKYADLADVSQTVLPRMAKHGLSFSAKPTVNESNHFVLSYALRHTGGESDCGEYPLPSGTPQQVGSAITYARRYILLSLSGVAPDEDDDGQAAATTRVEVPQRQREPEWDPTEQEMYVDGYAEDIKRVETADQLAEVGQAIARARANGQLSPNSYEHLARAGAARRAELNGVSA